MNTRSKHPARARLKVDGFKIQPMQPAQGLAPPPTQGRGGDHFPNVEILSHTGQKFRLYDDLIRDRVVLINFMTISSHADYPVTQHLAKIAELLGERLGRDVFMYSITTDPRRDTLQRLNAFAEQQGVRPGWHFLTASTRAVEKVSHRLFPHQSHSLICGKGRGAGYGHPARMVHYGNGGLGLWGAFAADSDPHLAVTRISWVQKGQPPTGPVRRAGPRRLANDFHTPNREA